MCIRNISDIDIQCELIKVKEALLKNYQALAIEQTNETLKPIKYSYIELDRCINIIDDGIGFIRFRNFQSGLVSSNNTKLQWYEVRIPIGKVIGITPFSSPYSSFIHKFVNSFISKNIFYFKPSVHASKCGKFIYELCKLSLSEQYSDYLNILELNDEQMELKFDYSDYACILFTGKSQTAKKIKQKIGRKSAVFETGSSAIVYVDKTANIDTSINKILKGAFDQNRMRCVAVKNIFLDTDIFDDFISKFISKTKKLICGSPLNIKTDVGSMREDLSTELILNIKELLDSGYRVLLGNTIKQNILYPTILYSGNSTKASTKEMFGPVVCIHKVKDMADIQSEYFKRSSLSSAIYTNFVSQMNNWQNRAMHSSSVFINHGPTERIDYLPFGGFNDENEGKEGFAQLYNLLTKQQIIYQNC